MDYHMGLDVLLFMTHSLRRFPAIAVAGTVENREPPFAANLLCSPLLPHRPTGIRFLPSCPPTFMITMTALS
jgi:hypothetical protein